MTAYFDFFLPPTLILHLQGVRDICVLFINIIMMDVFVVDFLPFGITGTPEQFFRCRLWFRCQCHIPTFQRGSIRIIVMILFLLFVEQEVSTLFKLFGSGACLVGYRKNVFGIPEFDVFLDV